MPSESICSAIHLFDKNNHCELFVRVPPESWKANGTALELQSTKYLLRNDMAALDMGSRLML